MYSYFIFITIFITVVFMSNARPVVAVTDLEIINSGSSMWGNHF